MKHLFITLLFLCAFSVKTSAQDVTYDPCGELRIALVSADRLVVEGKLDEALTKLNKFKNDSEMKNCPEMKEGVVDYKINEIQKKIDDLKPKLQSYKQCPDNNHPHLIDLGLPSGTKWACCNVGAKIPEGYGDDFAWGETEIKKEYKEITYRFCTGEDTDGDGKYDKNVKYQNLGESICGTQYDVAHVKWGAPWQMPSKEQIDELFNNCKWNKIKKTRVNGVLGRKFISKINGASIFLPVEESPYGHSSYGYYWSGALDSQNEDKAYYRRFDADCYNCGVYSGYMKRSAGLRVRPVAK